MFKSLIACALSTSFSVGRPGIKRSTNNNVPVFGRALRQFRRIILLRLSFQSLNYALEDDRIGEVGDHFEEIAGDKFCTIDNSEALKMFVRSIGASGKIKHRTKKLRIFSSYGADQFARPASDVHEMGDVSKSYASKMAGVTSRVRLG